MKSSPLPDSLCLRASDILARPPRYPLGLISVAARQHWSREDEGAVRVLCAHEADLEQIAPILGRTVGAIIAKAVGVGLTIPPSWRYHVRERRQWRWQSLQKENVGIDSPRTASILSSFDDHALVVRVKNLVPHGLPGDLQSDVTQDILLAILEGHLSPTDLRGKVPSYIREARKRYQMPWGVRNLDEPIFEDGRPLGEMISENRLYTEA